MKKSIASKEFSLVEICELKEDETDIREVVTCTVDTSIEKIELMDTKKGISLQGTISEGKRIVVLVTFKIITKYTSYGTNKIFIDVEKKNKFLYIDCARSIEGIDIKDLHRKKKINIEVFVDRVNYKKMAVKIFEVKIGGRVNLLK